VTLFLSRRSPRIKQAKIRAVFIECEKAIWNAFL